MSELNEPTIRYDFPPKRDERMRSLSNVIDGLPREAVLLCPHYPYLTDDVRAILNENAALRPKLDHSELENEHIFAAFSGSEAENAYLRAALMELLALIDDGRLITNENLLGPIRAALGEA